MPELLLIWFVIWCLVQLPIPEPWRMIAIIVGLVLGVLALLGHRLILGIG